MLIVLVLKIASWCPGQEMNPALRYPAKKETDIGSRRLLVIQVEIRRPGSPQGFRS